MKNHIKKVLFIFSFIFLLLALLVLSNYSYTSFSNKLFVENSHNKVKDIFRVDKIVFFSSCTANSNINTNNTTTINNLCQYTDIAIFINNFDTNFSMENTFKSVSIKDISFNVVPELGTPHLYYKSLTDFATPKITPENLIQKDLNFSVSSENEIDYTKPILFNNRANPITLGYVNSTITTDYTLNHSSNSLSYDGSLLKHCNILLKNIECSFSCTIFIENNYGEKFKCPIYITIPFENDSSSIYDGSYTYTYNPNYIFYNYE